MEKLKLNLDDLKVESFDTTPMQLERSRGTVYGYNHTEEVGCEPATPGVPTCAGATCYALCSWGGCTPTPGFSCNNTDDGSTCLCW